MAVLLDLMQRYPDKFIPGTDYVASFGLHDDFPGYEPIDGSPRSTPTTLEGVGDRVIPGVKGYGNDRGGCHKTEMTHSEQITDTSSLNMFYNDELFTQMVLGANFFRVAGLETKFAPPPLCRHDPDKAMSTATVPWKPTTAMAVMETKEAKAQPSVYTLQASPSWSATAFVVAVAVASGLIVGLVYVAGLKHGVKAAEKDGVPYQLQTGSAPLHANA